MAPNIEVITATGTSGTSFTSLAAAAGDSLTVRNFAGLSALLQAWYAPAASATVLETRIFSPEMHDNVNGIRLESPVDQATSADLITQPLIPDEFPQPLNPQQTLTVQTISAAQTDQVGLLLYYDNLLGISQRMATADYVKQHYVNILGVEVTLGTGSTYAATSTAINATNDQFRANTDYALLGYTCGGTAAASQYTVVGIKGPDTGNLHVGGPGYKANPLYTKTWFQRLSRTYGVPLVPIINSANKTSTFVECTSAASVTTGHISLTLAQMDAYVPTM